MPKQQARRRILNDANIVERLRQTMSALQNPQQIQVTCIVVGFYGSGCEAITHIGAGGYLWEKRDAITAIENQSHSFYTYVSGNYAWVGVVDGPNGKYLQTHADGYWNNNLLALQRCQ